MKKLIASILTTFFFLTAIHAQETYAFAEGSEVKVDGSSTVSDWSVPVKQMEGKMALAEGFSGKEGEEVKDILIVMEVKSMEGRGPDMNEKIYKAFKAEEFPQIIFESSSAKCTQTSGGSFKLSSNGSLKMAGESKEIVLLLEGKKAEKGFEFWGSHKLDMTAYGMEPPTAFFGSLEVEKEVTVIFKILVNT